MSIEVTHTQFGFKWGAANIVRYCEDEKRGWVLIGLETPRHQGNGVH